MAVTFRVEQFEGPLDLLLQLVEKEELDISTVSLAKVADQFLAYVQESTEIPLEETADFLVVAAKLIYLKSKLLLPSFTDTDLEEGPDLESQLRRYRAFVSASKRIEEMWNSGLRSYPRSEGQRAPEIVRFVPPIGVTLEFLQQSFQRVVARLEPIRNLPHASIERMISIQEKIRSLFTRVKSAAKFTFHEFVGHRATRPEQIVSFLALLELVKQRFVRVAQTDLFTDIEIEAHPEAPAVDPLAESFL